MTIRITALNPEILYERGFSTLTDPPPVPAPQDAGACCDFTAPDKVGDMVAVITIIAGSGNAVSGIIIRAESCVGGYVDVYSDLYGGDITDGGTDPFASVTDTQYTIDNLPAGSTLIIDAVERLVTLTDSAGRGQLSSLDVLDWVGVFEWIEAAKGGCERLCADVSGATLNADTELIIQMVEREL